MNPVKIMHLLIVLMFVFIPTSTLAVGKHALLIGIQDYKNTNLQSLKGPANDIKLTQGVLRERFEFQDKDFTILLDAQATHTGIKKAFTALVKRIKSDDFVYIHYSGHGSQTTDLNGDERSGKDQTWVSYGARSTKTKGIDNFDVLDDEIDGWLAGIYAKTTQVVFVSDSCHSATVSRGVSRGEIFVRSAKDDKRSHILGKKLYEKPTVYHGIQVGSARDRESAIELAKNDGQRYGVFTWYWTQALQKAQAGHTWQDVFKQTYAQVTAERGIVQRPQITSKYRQQVLGGDFTPQLPTIPIIKVSDKQVQIQAGLLMGVTKGSVYRLYKPKHSNPQDLPSLTITKAQAFASYANAKGTFKVGDLVVEESHVYPFTPIKVYLEADFSADKDKSLLQSIKSAFQPRPDGSQQLPSYVITNDPKITDLRLYLLRPKRENGQFIRASVDDALPKSFPNEPPELWVLTQDQHLLHENLQIQFGNPTRGLQLLRDNLNRLARVKELKKLQRSRRSAKLPVTLETYLLRSDEACPTRKGCEFLSDDLGWYHKTGPFSLQDIEARTLAKGDILTFILHNQSKRAYYCYLIDISPDGAIYSIFPAPDEGADYARVKAGERRDLIGEVGLMAELVGEETIKFIVTRQPIDVSLLEQGGFERRGGFDNRGDFDTRGDLNPLEQLLVNAVHGQRGRVSLRNDEWASGQVGFEVE